MFLDIKVRSWGIVASSLCKIDIHWVLDVVMRNKLTIVALALAICALSFGFRGAGANALDLSTPQTSFAVIVDILKAGNVSALPKIATPTGQASLVALYKNEDYQDGMTVLGRDLSTSLTKWEEITEDIYFVSAKVGEKIHKMEFTKEEPGWMLYHWQIGGGADAHGIDKATEPQD